MKTPPRPAVFITLALCSIVVVLLFAWLELTGSLRAGKGNATTKDAPFVNTVGAAVESADDADILDTQRSPVPNTVTTSPSLASSNKASSLPSHSAAWGQIAKSERLLGKMFALAPGKIELDDLARHTELNPADTEFSLQQRRELEDIIASNRVVVKDAGLRFGSRRNEVIWDLHGKGHLQLLSLDMLDPAAQAEIRQSALAKIEVNAILLSNHLGEVPSREKLERQAVKGELRMRVHEFIPDASGFLIHKGELYVATSEQLSPCEAEREIMLSARRDFLHHVLSWFISEGFTPTDNASAIVEQFEEFIDAA